MNVVQARRNGYPPLPIRMAVVADPPGAVLSLSRQILLQAAQQATRSRDSEATPPTPSPPEEPIHATVRNRFQAWQDRLLDLSTRNNRLLNLGQLSNNRRRPAALILDVPEALLPELVNLLDTGRPFSLLGDQGSGQGDEGLARTALELSRGRCRTRLALDSEEPMPAEALLKTGKALARTARLAVEETGFSPLYLAVGLLQWSDKTQTPRLAPLLLLPVELQVDNRQQLITLRRSQGEPLSNIALFERLRQDFDLSLEVLTDLAEDDRGLDVEYLLDAVRHTIIGRSGWRVLPAALITTFSFATFLLWRDLRDNRDLMLESEAVRHIATAGRDPFPDPLPDFKPEDLDDLSVREIPMVCEADSSQIGAVHAAIQGRSFVLQGPPGTGKSQTITNIIAAAMAAGRTVLFVAQKAAAVEVVRNRLKAIDLDDFCLDLHGPDSSPEQVHGSLQQALRAQQLEPERWQALCEEHDQARQTLRAYSKALHQRRPIGRSLFQMLSALQEKSDLPDLPDLLQPDQLTEDVFRSQLEQIRAYATAHALHPVRDSNPWLFLPEPRWSVELEQRLRTRLPQLRVDLQRFAQRLEALRSEGLPLPSLCWHSLEPLAEALVCCSRQRIPQVVLDPERWEGARQAASSWLKEGQKLEGQEGQLRSRWEPQTFERNLEPLIERLKSLLASFVLVRWIAAFFFRRHLRGLARQPGMRLLQVLEDWRGIEQLPGRKREMEQRRQELTEQLITWDGTASSLPELLREWQDFAALLAKSTPDRSALLRYVAGLPEPDTAKLHELHMKVREGFKEVADWLHLPALPLPGERNQPLEQLERGLQRLLGDLPGLRDWTLARELEADFRRTGPGPVLDWAAVGSLPVAELENAYRTAVFRHWCARIIDSEPALRRFSSSTHTSLVDRFRALDGEVRKLSRRAVRASVIRRMPNRQHTLSGSELAELNRELAKKKRRLPLRALFSRIPTLLPKLKPCLLASPISVARFLPADGQRFDIVIFDEASQVETHHAIGAIGRGQQVVIVGDNKQMPPSSFFQRPATADEGLNTADSIDDLESILDEALACGLPQQMLRWHYRSRHEALIAFSNTHYYNSSLNIFPSPWRQNSDLGLHWHPVPDGCYQPGERVNEQEAKTLVFLLLERLRTHSPGERSFGVITFSIPQQLLIENLLQKVCEQEPELEDWFSRDNIDYCFVKNLETVQGDERDEIFFSICFAPRKDGVLSMTFGALNKVGGERRLNVAITRARYALHVVSTLQPEQIDRSRTNALAVHQLQDYLLFCRNQQRLAERPRRYDDFDGDLQRHIHDLLTQEGYQVDCKVGCANYRIDLAVIDPQEPYRYRIGIECDGDAYATTATVRDRDHVRTAVLEQLGWMLHRVWSVEWQLNPENEKRRLLDAVRRAFASPLSSSQGGSSRSSLQAPLQPAPRRPSSPLLPSPATPPPPPPSALAPIPMELGKPYELADLAPSDGDLRAFHTHQASPVIVNRLLALVAVEAPILLRQATLRVTQCWNSRAFSQKAHERIFAIARDLHRQNRLFLDQDETLWMSHSQSEGWQTFRRPPADGRSIDTIPMAERRAALLLITREALSMDPDTLLREAFLQLTGGTRFTQQQRREITGALDQLLKQGVLVDISGRIFASEGA